MARENRVRLSDEEMQKLRAVREQRYSDGLKDDIPFGAVVGELCEGVLNGDG